MLDLGVEFSFLIRVDSREFAAKGFLICITIHSILSRQQRSFSLVVPVLLLFLAVGFAFAFGFGFDFLSLALIFSCFPPPPPFLRVEGFGSGLDRAVPISGNLRLIWFWALSLANSQERIAAPLFEAKLWSTIGLRREGL